MRVVWDSHTHTSENAREFMNSNPEILESEARTPSCKWEWRKGVRHSDRQRSFQYNKYYFVTFLVPSIMFSIRGISTSFSLINLSHRRSILLFRAESICSKLCICVCCCLCFPILLLNRECENEPKFQLTFQLSSHFRQRFRCSVHSCTWILHTLRRTYLIC